MTHYPRLAAGALTAALGLFAMSAFADEPAAPAPPDAAAPLPPKTPAAPGLPAGSSGAILTEEQQITRLVQTLQDRIELDSRLAGTLVLGGQLFPREEGGRSLLLRGKFSAEDQIQLATDLIPFVLAEDPYWSTVRDEVFVDLRGMPIIAPSGLFAARYYGLGMDFFLRGDYAAADRSFARAISEAPAIEAYRWWSVLTAIAKGQEQRAQAKLQPLLAINPYGSQAPAIAAELTRIQGPLRWKLQALEKVVLLNDILGAPTAAPPGPATPPAEPEPQEVRAPGVGGTAAKVVSQR